MNFLAISTEITILLLALFLIVMDLVLPERESRKAMAGFTVMVLTGLLLYLFGQ